MGCGPLVPPFLVRAGYIPVPRPFDPQGTAPKVNPPPALCGVVDYPVLARIAQRLNITLSQLDELSMEEILDEVDLIHYLHDIDNPPAEPPKPKAPNLAGLSSAI